MVSTLGVRISSRLPLLHINLPDVLISFALLAKLYKRLKLSQIGGYLYKLTGSCLQTLNFNYLPWCLLVPFGASWCWQALAFKL